MPVRENQPTRDHRAYQPGIDPEGYRPVGGLRSALNPEAAAQLLLAVLDDNRTLVTRLDMLAAEFAKLDHTDRIRLGARFPALEDALLAVEHYQAIRQGVV